MNTINISPKKRQNIHNKRMEMFNGMTKRGCSSEKIALKLQEYDERMYHQQLLKSQNYKRKKAIKEQRALAESLMTPSKRQEQKKYRAEKHKWFLNEHQRIKRAPQHLKKEMSLQLKEKNRNLTCEEFRLRSIFIMETLKSKFNKFCDIISSFEW